MSGSFVHAYLAVPSSPSDFPLECHHSVIMDWGKKIDAKQNMVIISIPTVFDPTLAPEGFHIIHAYTAASDDFEEFKARRWRLRRRELRGTQLLQKQRLHKEP